MEGGTARPHNGDSPARTTRSAAYAYTKITATTSAASSTPVTSSALPENVQSKRVMMPSLAFLYEGVS